PAHRASGRRRCPWAPPHERYVPSPLVPESPGLDAASWHFLLSVGYAYSTRCSLLHRQLAMDLPFTNSILSGHDRLLVLPAQERLVAAPPPAGAAERAGGVGAALGDSDGGQPCGGDVTEELTFQLVAINEHEDQGLLSIKRPLKQPLRAPM